jgi:hypothetical protein
LLITPSFAIYCKQNPQQESERTVLQHQYFASVLSTIQYKVSPLRLKLNLHKYRLQEDIFFPKMTPALVSGCGNLHMRNWTFFFFITFQSALDVPTRVKQILYSQRSSVFIFYQCCFK